MPYRKLVAIFCIMDKSKIKPIIIDDSFTLGANNHSFNVSLANQIGLTEAILMQNFYHWHCSNKENTEMIKDGRVWFYRSVSKISEEYTYLSSDKIRNAIERLVASELLLKGNYSEEKFKRANWYSLSDLALSIMETGRIIKAEITEPFGKIPNHSVNYQLSYNKESYNNNKEEEDKSSSKKDIDDFVDAIYKMYPTKCPKRNTSLGKCSKDKERIRRLLRTYTMEQIAAVVKYEIDTKYGKEWMQNFSTFLNNFPDPDSIDELNKSRSADERKSNDDDRLIINGVEYK